MMGRHHARILQSLPGVAFAGAVDPAGDRIGAVRDPALVFASIDELLAAPPSTSRSSRCRPRSTCRPRALAAAGVHVLIEKPLAATSGEARADHRRVRGAPACTAPSATSSASTRR